MYYMYLSVSFEGHFLGNLEGIPWILCYHPYFYNQPYLTLVVNLDVIIQKNLQKIQPASFFFVEDFFYLAGKNIYSSMVKTKKTARFDGFLTDD